MLRQIDPRTLRKKLDGLAENLLAWCEAAQLWWSVSLHWRPAIRAAMQTCVSRELSISLIGLSGTARDFALRALLGRRSATLEDRVNRINRVQVARTPNRRRHRKSEFNSEADAQPLPENVRLTVAAGPSCLNDNVIDYFRFSQHGQLLIVADSFSVPPNEPTLRWLQQVCCGFDVVWLWKTPEIQGPSVDRFVEDFHREIEDATPGHAMPVLTIDQAGRCAELESLTSRHSQLRSALGLSTYRRHLESIALEFELVISDSAAQLQSSLVQAEADVKKIESLTLKSIQDEANEAKRQLGTRLDAIARGFQQSQAATIEPIGRMAIAIENSVRGIEIHWLHRCREGAEDCHRLTGTHLKHFESRSLRNFELDLGSTRMPRTWR